MSYKGLSNDISRIFRSIFNGCGRIRDQSNANEGYGNENALQNNEA